MEEWGLIMFGVAFAALLLGFPVALTLGAVAMLFGGIFLGLDFFELLPLRIWGIMTNFTLSAVPLFVFMGILLDKSGIAEELLRSASLAMRKTPGGMAVAIVLVGALLAATTGVVGATVVTMGVIALPVLLKNGYRDTLSCGTIAASGTLGQLIPPSIVLVLLGDVMGVPVGRLFAGTVIPGLLLITGFIGYIIWVARRHPEYAPPHPEPESGDASIKKQLLIGLLPPLLLIFAVLGSIFMGIASPTESAALGAMGALLLALIKRQLSLHTLQDGMQQTLRMTCMVFLILIGATAFGLVFRGLGSDQLLADLLTQLPGGEWGFLLFSMAIVFVLGFFLDFIEISFIAVPLLTPIAQAMGIDLLWFAVLIAVNLQTSFLTPPFGFSLFYLKAVAPKDLPITRIYRGILPFVGLQLALIGLLMLFPGLVSWLPDLLGP